jgi:hypothetical protein
MKALLTITAVVTALAVAAPGALGAGKPQGYTIITDTLGGNGSPKATPDVFERAVAVHEAWQVQARQAHSQSQGMPFITDTLGGNGHAKQVQGYTFMTDTLAPGGGPPIEAAPSTPGFSWADAGVGAGTAAGALLLLLGGSLAVARRQGRLAI